MLAFCFRVLLVYWDIINGRYLCVFTHFHFFINGLNNTQSTSLTYSRDLWHRPWPNLVSGSIETKRFFIQKAFVDFRYAKSFGLFLLVIWLVFVIFVYDLLRWHKWCRSLTEKVICLGFLFLVTYQNLRSYSFIYDLTLSADNISATWPGCAN